MYWYINNYDRFTYLPFKTYKEKPNKLLFSLKGQQKRPHILSKCVKGLKNGEIVVTQKVNTQIQQNNLILKISQINNSWNKRNYANVLPPREVLVFEVGVFENDKSVFSSLTPVSAVFFGTNISSIASSIAKASSAWSTSASWKSFTLLIDSSTSCSTTLMMLRLFITSV